MPLTARPFAALPPETADALRPVLAGLAEETIAAIASEVPDYARAMEGAFGGAVRRGVEVAFERFLALIEDPAAEVGGARATYVDLGRGEFHAGRSLDALLAAYRVGARLAWRRFVEAGREAGLSPEVLYDLGEAIFAYIDEISAESADGYAQEQSAAAGETQRRRRRLVRLLAQDPPAGEEAVRTAARAAAWVLPRAVAALVTGEAAPGGGVSSETEIGGVRGAAIPGEEEADAEAARLARALGGGALGGAAAGVACVFVPDPDAPGRRRQLEAALGDTAAALGPTVAWPRGRREPAPRRVRPAAARLRPLARHRARRRRRPPRDAAAQRRHRAGRRARRGAARAARGPQRRPARAADHHAAGLDRPSRARSRRSRRRSACTPRPCATGWPSCASCSASALEDPDARFELALALRLA